MASKLKIRGRGLYDWTYELDGVPIKEVMGCVLDDSKIGEVARFTITVLVDDVDVEVEGAEIEVVEKTRHRKPE